MHDAARAVAALAREVQVFAVLFLRERHAVAAQPGDGLGRMLHDEARRGRVAQAGAGDQRVSHVGVEAVVLGQHGGDAALGPAAGAVGERPLGEHRHAVGGRELERGGQAGEPAADDEHVEIVKGHGER
ncbi:MAG: hypothetical protein GAK38_01888 [Xylophilus sp.]|nr:MAG: hypothetical protein GAK38_01888 [Xylophilus sp.]